MKILNYTALVQKFRTTGGNNIPSTLNLPTYAAAEKRADFIRSELIEYLDAVKEGSKAKAVDGLIDAIYFCEDGLLEMGGTPAFVFDLFQEVNRANMTKYCKTQLEAEESCLAYINGTHPRNGNNEKYTPQMRLVGDFWVIYDLMTNKTLKSINTEEPNVQGIIDYHYPTEEMKAAKKDNFRQQFDAYTESI